MYRSEKLEQKVRELYERQDPDRADWADWLYENHVFIVAENAENLAKRFNAPADLCRAAAMLHDIADVDMSRFDPQHEEHSFEIGRKLLESTGFSQEEVAVIVDDAVKLHGCKEGQKPESLVGKILATADALAHLNTDFYTYTTQNLLPQLDVDERREWAAKKLPRDYYDKIAFDEVRDEAKPSFDKLTAQFGKD